MEKRITFYTPDGEHELDVVVHFTMSYDDYGVDGSQFTYCESKEFILYEDKKNVTEVYDTWPQDWKDELDSEIEYLFYN
jgi:hypothetical protein